MDIRIIVEAFNSQNICLGLNKFYLYFFNSSGIARIRMTGMVGIGIGGMFIQEYAIKLKTKKTI